MIRDYYDTPTFRKRMKQLGRLDEAYANLRAKINYQPDTGSITRGMTSMRRLLEKFVPDAKKEKELKVLRESMKEILDRTEKEKKRDYDAALKGGILEIHDIANMAVNHWMDA